VATNALSSSEVVSDFRIAQEEQRLRERGTVLLYTFNTSRSALILLRLVFIFHLVEGDLFYLNVVGWGIPVR
jgi:hypothetical protein